ncbi:MAG TPA: hypothetical protein VJS92_05085 [Candidatus Polarisedimenticolaceae bacterium]|nr:hypothetical protein [Candidatus Polarisedimenticolaceae bacterium]
MNRKLWTCIGAVVLVLDVRAATTPYSANFESGIAGPEWSITTVDTTPTARKFLGQFAGNDAVTLTLTPLPAHTALHVAFDVYVINSWDGNDVGAGPDIWELKVTPVGPTLLHTTFSTHSYAGDPRPQAYPGPHPGSSNPARTGVSEPDNSLGYPVTPPFFPLGDSVYHFSFSFAHSASTAQLQFSGSGLEVLANESWGVDNVTVVASTKVWRNDYRITGTGSATGWSWRIRDRQTGGILGTDLSELVPVGAEAQQVAATFALSIQNGIPGSSATTQAFNATTATLSVSMPAGSTGFLLSVGPADGNPETCTSTTLPLVSCPFNPDLQLLAETDITPGSGGGPVVPSSVPTLALWGKLALTLALVAGAAWLSSWLRRL